jgi:hypothetical protein
MDDPKSLTAVVVVVVPEAVVVVPEAVVVVVVPSAAVVVVVVSASVVVVVVSACWGANVVERRMVAVAGSENCGEVLMLDDVS